MHKIKKILLKLPFFIPLYLLLKKTWHIPSFVTDFLLFNKLQKSNSRFDLKLIDIFPCLIDKTSETKFEPHYIYHPAWAARVVKKINPQEHVDISSTLHFSTLLSAFLPVKFYDYRPAFLNLENLVSESADLTKLHFSDNSIDSLSCLHVVEHIGLGRYGDEVDPDGDVKAINELKRVVRPGGNLIFVVPVGKPKIQFNAHRIYSYEQVTECFNGFTLKEFSLVPDNFMEAGLILNADPELVKKQDWGCGCFWFVKN